MPRLLLIEDEPSVAASLSKVLRLDGYDVRVAHRPAEGLSEAASGRYDVIVTDLQMPGSDGMQVIRELRASQPHLPVILMTAHHTTETAIQATKFGAFDYVLKPIDPPELLDKVRRAVETRRRVEEPLAAAATSLADTIVGRSPQMRAVYMEIGRVASRPVTVLIRGQTGTGKELVARAIYQHSDRANKPFVVVNCAAIPETLLESELFGHEAGAFTDAKARRIGRFEQADGGTIFLDEIGELNPLTQSKLLRVLQDSSITRLGGKDSITVDVRVIAATHRNLEQAIQAREFREDLYYRLNGYMIHLPPLAERREDIPDLVQCFLRRHGPELGSPNAAITPDAIDYLCAQPWPGNVRELENCIRKSLLLSHGYPINAVLVQRALAQAAAPAPAANQSVAAFVAELLSAASRNERADVSATLTEAVERELYSQAIKLASGDQSKAARWLGVSRPTMREKLLRHGLLPR